jgi:hypothetical protein
MWIIVILLCFNFSNASSNNQKSRTASIHIRSSCQSEVGLERRLILTLWSTANQKSATNDCHDYVTHLIPAHDRGWQNWMGLISRNADTWQTRNFYIIIYPLNVACSNINIYHQLAFPFIVTLSIERRPLNLLSSGKLQDAFSLIDWKDS